MALTTGWLRCGLFFGAGVVVGSAAALLLSRNSGSVHKGVAAMLSHTLDAKEKAKTAVATAKETLEDLTAEARHESAKRKAAKA